MAATGANPASAQSSPSLMAALTTSCTDDSGLPNTLQFLSFQSVHATKSSRELNSGLDVCSMQSLWHIHHSQRSSSPTDMRGSNCNGQSNGSQTCLVKTQPMKRWLPVSAPDRIELMHRRPAAHAICTALRSKGADGGPTRRRVSPAVQPWHAKALWPPAAWSIL
jgi:hypothetical protein